MLIVQLLIFVHQPSVCVHHSANIVHKIPPLSLQCTVNIIFDRVGKVGMYHESVIKFGSLVVVSNEKR